MVRSSTALDLARTHLARDRMYERCIERRRRSDVRARQVARHLAHHDFSEVHTSNSFSVVDLIVPDRTADVYRPSLTKYHTHLLTLIGDGTGRWTFTPIASSPVEHAAAPDASTACPTTPGGHAAGDLIRVLEEIRSLERQLDEAKVWEARVRELEEALQVREGADPSQAR